MTTEPPDQQSPEFLQRALEALATLRGYDNFFFVGGNCEKRTPIQVAFRGDFGQMWDSAFRNKFNVQPGAQNPVIRAMPSVSSMEQGHEIVAALTPLLDKHHFDSLFVIVGDSTTESLPVTVTIGTAGEEWQSILTASWAADDEAENDPMRDGIPAGRGVEVRFPAGTTDEQMLAAFERLTEDLRERMSKRGHRG